MHTKTEEVAQQAWNKCLSFIRDVVEEMPYKTFFLPIKPLSLENNTLVLEVASNFIYEQLEGEYLELLGKAIRKEIGEHIRLEYSVVIDQKSSRHINYPSAQHKNTEEAFTIRNPFVIPGLRKHLIESQLNPTHTFDNFLESASNRVARQAGIEIAKKPASTMFNPIMVYGKVGVGKTHLLHAIGNLCVAQHAQKKVLYVSAEKFINQFQMHAKNKIVNDFVHFYQIIDVLLIDDVQFFEKAPHSQDALFAIFNHLHHSGKQIVLSSDRSPQALENVNDRLISRFKCGLVDEIKEPDVSLKEKVLRMKCKADGCTISEEVLKYIAQYSNNNMRDLEGIRLAMIAQTTFANRPMDLSLAKEVLRNFTQKESIHEISCATIQRVICTQLNISEKDLLSRSRKREIAHARQLAMYLSKQLTSATLKNIGECFGGRDHTTVMHACKTVSDSMEVDPSVKELVNLLIDKITLTATPISLKTYKKV